MELKNKIVITVPTESKGEAVPLPFIESTVNELQESACKQFGGATTHTAQGSWWSDEREEVVNETVLLITIFSDKEHSYNKQWAEDTAGYVKVKLAQEAAAYEYNGTLYLV